ncbi:NB-ARC domain-containing protein [Streptomyces sp. NPDC046261]|uniref:NB-ARC domain-containing protein n=1 Tax=Streptomyces sp. NPDC046261 TaxID=3157200 RepID=UPI0033E9BD64
MGDEGQGLSFGPLLRRCRLAAGMTQAELADVSGLSVRAISDMERGRTGRPRRTSVELLAGALGRGGEAARGLVEAARAARLAPEREPPPSDGCAPPCELPPDIPDFTGREHALRRLGGALSPGGRRGGGAAPARQRLTLVVGHPGAGKTALAVHAAHLSRSRFPDGQIYVDLAPAGRPAQAPHEVVRRILQSLGATDGAAASLESLEESSARLRAVLARRRVLIVLDGAGSEGQIRCVRPAVGESAVIATCRRRLTALADAECVEARPFSPQESLTFLARMLGEDRVRAERSEAALVAELCGHLPLALRVIGCRLLARPHWTMRTLADEVLHDPRTRLRELSSGDLTVRSVMAAAFGALDEPTRSALRTLAADRAPGFSPHSAAATLGCSVARAHRIIGDLLDGQLVEVLDGPPSGVPRCLIPPVVRLFAAEGAEPAGGAGTAVASPAGQRVV